MQLSFQVVVSPFRPFIDLLRAILFAIFIAAPAFIISRKIERDEAMHHSTVQLSTDLKNDETNEEINGDLESEGHSSEQFSLPSHSTYPSPPIFALPSPYLSPETETPTPTPTPSSPNEKIKIPKDQKVPPHLTSPPPPPPPPPSADSRDIDTDTPKSLKLFFQDIPYGSSAYQKLDIYVPFVDLVDSATTMPVVLFIQGSGWTTSKKDLYAALGTGLRKNGIVCVIPDYGTLPKSSLHSIKEDISNTIYWTFQNIQKYGGNPFKLYVVGHSTGAHLSILSILAEFEDFFKEKGNISDYSLNNICNDGFKWKFPLVHHYIAISGIYDIPQFSTSRSGKGFPSLMKLTEKDHPESHSPLHLVMKLIRSGLTNGKVLPSVTIIHGTRDHINNLNSANSFDRLLRELGVKGDMIVYKDHSHQEALMEVMHGYSNARMIIDIIKIVHTGSSHNSIDSNPSLYWRLARTFMRNFCPV